jgi:hypothetical protein
LQNYFTVDSGGDKGQKMPLYDGTIEKYNGYYYVAGTGTAGNLYKSKDMVHWDGPTRFISDDPATLPPYAPNDNTYPRYGASDFYFNDNVMFYGFNSTNLLHGNPATMATDQPDFRHSFWDKQYDTGIDLQFFVAPNGDKLILRKVNPGEPDPNNLSGPALGRPGTWMWKVKSFFDELGNPDRGQAKELLHTSPGMWSNLNHLNFEGPELYYRNGQYYLLNASNQMDARSGLYDTGVAQSDDYNTFDNSKKLPNKLLGRNIESLLLKYNTILPTSEFGAQTYTYTFADPGTGWQNAGFDTTGWQSGDGGFGFPLYTVKPARVPSIYTIWGSPDTPENLWARRTFNLTSVPDTVVLRHRLEGFGKLYINGVEVVDQEGNQPGYANVEVPKGILKPGANVIAATMSRTGPQSQTLADYSLDFGLYDTKGEPVEADIVGPSQPNIIEGPNGFETWITYKAFWNGVNGQGKDRVYFWGNEMVADGPTSSSSSGVHFDASAPSFEDRFNNEISWNNYDQAPDGAHIQDGILSINSMQGTKQMLLKDRMPSNYDMEANIRFDDSTGLAGVTVWYQDDANQIRLLVDRDRRKYVIETIQNGQTTSQVEDLPYTYQFVSDDPRAADFGEQFHALKVYKNGTQLKAELDHYKLNNDQPVLDSALLQTPGKVGLVCQNSMCSIDNVTLTSGWSESGSQINSWSSPTWTSGAQGLVSPASGQALNVKGDALNEYEFSTNVTSDTLPSTGESGIIVEYKDANNYVAAVTNYATHQFELYKVENGQTTPLQSTSTARDEIYGWNNYDEANYNLNCGTATTPACDIGQLDYIYKLRAPAEISGAKILWTYGNFDYLKKTGANMFKLPNVTSPNFGFDSWDNAAQSWSPVGFTYDGAGQRGVFQTSTFNSNQTTDQIRLKVPSKINRPYTFAVHEEISGQNFYRTVRKDGQLYVWVNNQLLFKQADPFAGVPARAGLYANDLAANFDSITAFEVKNPRLEVAAPQTDTASGELISGTSVTLSTYTDGAQIYYTTDGSAPSTSSQLYTGPIAISQPTTLRAIAAKDGMNESEELVRNYTVFVPAAPVLNPAIAGDSKVNLTWSPVTGATSYNIYERGGSESFSSAIATVAGDVYQYEADGLTDGTSYTFAVKAVSSSGNGPGSESPFSIEVSATPVAPIPDAPAIASAVPGSGKVTIYWDSVDRATGYQLYMSRSPGIYGDAAATVGSAVYSYSFQELQNGTPYYFIVKAVNSGGVSAASNEVSATPVGVPGAPGNVTAVAGDKQAVVSFTAPSDDGGSGITGYVVTASQGNISVTGAGSPITVTGLTNDIPYTFTVQAVTIAGIGQPSVPSNTVIPEPSDEGQDKDRGKHRGKGQGNGQDKDHDENIGE